jgi:hypothetical protein
MLYLLLLLGYDSLPPLPDLSKITLPEPVLWVQPQERGLLLNGYAGQYNGTALDLDLNVFRARGQFERLNDWDDTDIGSAEIAANIILPRIWLKPQCNIRHLRRDDRYTQIRPGFGMQVFTRPFVAAGKFYYSRWLINDAADYEATGEMTLIFDRIDYFPSLVMRGIYTDEELKPSLYAQLHIGGFHIELGSPVVTGFPSPMAEIAYSDPWIKAKAAVQTGVKHNTLDEYFRPELPTRYRIDVPAETIKVAVDMDVTLNLRNQRFTVGGAYKEWLYRLNISENYEISTTRDVRETSLMISARNNLRFGNIDLHNVLNVQYNRSDSAIAFLPDIGITDTFAVNINGLELATDLLYLSQRSGVGKSFGRYYVLGAQAGFRVKFLKLYLVVHNITNEESEIYDDYFLTGRKYAGGLEIKQSF